MRTCTRPASSPSPAASRARARTRYADPCIVLCRGRNVCSNADASMGRILCCIRCVAASVARARALVLEKKAFGCAPSQRCNVDAMPQGPYASLDPFFSSTVSGVCATLRMYHEDKFMRTMNIQSEQVSELEANCQSLSIAPQQLRSTQFSTAHPKLLGSTNNMIPYVMAWPGPCSTTRTRTLDWRLLTG
jgi:hypothetical protein